MRAPRPQPRRAFTIAELMITVAIITVLVATVFIIAGVAMRTGRAAAERSIMRNMGIGIEQFRRELGFAPPLVDDGYEDGPIDTAAKAPRVKGLSTGVPGAPLDQQGFLRYEGQQSGNNPDSTRNFRYSSYSLSYYLLGSLGRDIDGVDGPGFRAPSEDGAFSPGGNRMGPLLDLGKDSERLQIGAQVILGRTENTQKDYRSVVMDRWYRPGDTGDHAFRYYRWAPTKHVRLTAGGSAPQNVYQGFNITPGAPGWAYGASVPANNQNLAGEIRSYNTPVVVGNPFDENSLRSATWAIVSAGPDGKINDITPDAPENKDNIIIWEGGQ